MRTAKTSSSRWVYQNWSRNRGFAWQTGYGALSVSESNAASVVERIREHEKHHRRVSFQEGFIIFFLKRNGVRVNLGIESFPLQGWFCVVCCFPMAYAMG